ncbi:MAG: ferrous iron transport protein B [Actinobacteria bacterium]|nr:MAG: ferrous iron transport protein B [Actinomycetota bacterium]
MAHSHAHVSRTEAQPAAGAVPGLTVALAGNPNVGKSTTFNQLTGSDVTTAHYAGTTTEVAVGTTILGERTVRVMDLPGVYSLGGRGDMDRNVRRALLEAPPDAVVAVVDETNLSRNLYLVLQLLDLGFSPVIGLNLHDEAERRGITTDLDALSEALGLPVVPMVAAHGVGVAEAFELAVEGADAGRDSRRPPRYAAAFERLVAPLTEACAHVEHPPYGLPPRALALQLLEDPHGVESRLTGSADAVAVAKIARSVRRELAVVAGGALGVVARERYAEADRIADRVQVRGGSHAHAGRDPWSLTTSLATGLPILLGVLGAVFGLLFWVGNLLATGFSALWGAAVSGPFDVLLARTVGSGIVADLLRWGLAGVEASLGVGIPYILTFYVMLSVLEDSGYLSSVAFLADRAMHKLGLHGLAVVSLVAAAGCNVPAVLSASALPSKRERFIASTLATMVPCSARTAVILGSVGAFLGVLPALGVFAVSAVVTATVGVLLQRFLPGTSSGLVMEVFPFRRPTLSGVWRKAWVQFRSFLSEAVPIVIVGSILLGGLYETGWLWKLTVVLDPVVVGWLGLPSVAGLTLLLGVLRKELALQLLVTLAVVAYGAHVRDVSGFMTQSQVFVYALVNTLAVPCVSTLAVLWRRLGWKAAGGIASITVIAALGAGGVAARALPYLVNGR